MLPVVPHFASECLKLLKINNAEWPTYNEKIIEEKNTNFVIQINGKKRGIINASKEINEKDLFNLLKKDNNVHKYLINKKIQKSIFVPQRLINLIIKDE